MSVRLCYVAVEFVDDENVVGNTYWYLCADEEVQVGDFVNAPLGRHNRVQEGIVRKKLFATEQNAPYPPHLVKHIVCTDGETEE